LSSDKPEPPAPRGIAIVRRIQQVLYPLTSVVFVVVLSYFILFRRTFEIIGPILFVFVFVFAYVGKQPAQMRTIRRGSIVAIAGISLLILIAAVNFIVNPYGIYPPHVIAPAAFNTTRSQKMGLFSAMNPPAEIVVLGSSRSFTVEPAYITEKTGLPAFNASFTSGSVRDYLGFTRYAVEVGRQPRVLIIGLSVEQLLADVSTTTEPGDPLKPYVENLRNKSLAVIGDKAEQLLTATQLQYSIQSLSRATQGNIATTYVIDPDGHVHFPEGNYRVPPDYVFTDEELHPWAPHEVWAANLNEVEVEFLQEFLTLCAEENISVIVYIPPFHPNLALRYQNETGLPQLQQQMLALLDEWGGNSVMVYDFTDVNAFGGSDTMFIDAVHPSEEASRLMLDVMLKDFATAK
jgi:hypothetical protein